MQGDRREYTFTNDTLFKMLFVKYPHLLKRLVSQLLKIENIEHFLIMNSESPPGSPDDKFCRLDIVMVVNDQKINLEVQVKNEGDFPERSLLHWARIYSNSIKAGHDYVELPRVVVINILKFKLFDCEDSLRSPCFAGSTRT